MLLVQVTIDWGALKPFIVGEPSPKSFPPIYSGSRLLAFATVKPNAPSSVITLKANTPGVCVSGSGWLLKPHSMQLITSLTAVQMEPSRGLCKYAWTLTTQMP